MTSLLQGNRKGERKRGRKKKREREERERQRERERERESVHTCTRYMIVCTHALVHMHPGVRTVYMYMFIEKESIILTDILLSEESGSISAAPASPCC